MATLVRDAAQRRALSSDPVYELRCDEESAEEHFSRRVAGWLASSPFRPASRRQMESIAVKAINVDTSDYTERFGRSGVGCQMVCSAVVV